MNALDKSLVATRDVASVGSIRRSIDDDAAISIENMGLSNCLKISAALPPMKTVAKLFSV